jgi:SpoVK/Ycf46/Vps4 family AAA+-type ATPase
MGDLAEDFVHLARLALTQRHDDALALVRRAARHFKSRPDLVGKLRETIEHAGLDGPLRGVQAQPIPVDSDSRLELLRRELVVELASQPVWPAQVAAELDGVVAERARENELIDAGLTPSRSMLFTGPPGVGKTLAARDLAFRLKRPLLTLDLAAVMSSFLGRTGNNIRVVLDYARKQPSVLLLDEFDAVAKRRDDGTEVGELKRLVTVLLQTIDDWPSDGLLIAATNHPELLDPAVWRRFERVVAFPLPGEDELAALMRRLLEDDAKSCEVWTSLLALLLRGQSFADTTKLVNHARKSAILRVEPLDVVLANTAAQLCSQGETKQRLAVAQRLMAAGKSQRQISSLTKLSRDTMRKHFGSAIGHAHEAGGEQDGKGE